jgi:hypothetical protein
MTTSRTVALLALALAAPAARAGEEVYLLRSEETSAFAASCPDGDNIRLAAFLYAPRTRATDALLVNEQTEAVGTAVGCGRITSIAPFDFAAPAPFSLAIDLGARSVFASGWCVVADRSFPLWPTPAPLLLVGCTLAVQPDAAQGIVRGVATSASVFLPVAIPGYSTGSYWTLHLYTPDPG